ncbi:MAG: endonuclease, partial [Verrucomicrobiales bacterium]
MQKLTLLLAGFLLGSMQLYVQAQAVFINELHYDNSGADTNEGLEIAGPAGTDLSAYRLVFY